MVLFLVGSAFAFREAARTARERVLTIAKTVGIEF